jgi:AmmeMemoRadiSam system protein A
MAKVAHPENPLTVEQKSFLLGIARESVRAAAAGDPLPSFDSDDPVLQERWGVFVTLTRDDELRGCLGEFVGREPLYEAVAERARASALEDPRFPSITPGEVDYLHIEISVLRPLKRIENVDEIEVGRHGLYISKGYFRGTLLPQVASERNWNRETFLRHTCIKAGLPPDAWQDPETEIFTYEADVFGERDVEGGSL